MNRTPAPLESLERRRLLAAAVAGDQLVITGTDAADTVAIHYDTEADEMVVTTNGQENTFTATGLTGLRVMTGAGDDSVTVDVSVTLSAALYGGEGHDSLSGGGGADQLFGGEGDDLLTGGNSHDLLRGGGGNDEIHGNGGNDSLWGHGGNDVLLGGDDDDLVRGGGGGDTLKGDAGSDTVLGHDGDDDIMGHDGDDLIRGHGGRDRLFAGRGEDAMDGGDDDDELDASLGENVVLGGPGSDTFVGDKKADIFADYETQSDWLAAMLTDARDGGVQRWRDESTGFFTPDHPAYEQLVAAFDRGASDVDDLRSEYGRPDSATNTEEEDNGLLPDQAGNRPL